MPRCEDFPCCGHTDLDPCERQPYDEPGYYDTRVPGQEHRLCDHANGECDVDFYDDEDEESDDALAEMQADSLASFDGSMS